MRQDRRRLGISRYDRVRRVVLRIGALRSGRYGALVFGVAVLVRDRLGKAGMVGLVAVRFVLEGRVSVVYEMACYVLAGVVGCVQSFNGQARRVLVRLAPVSQGRFDPVRVARIGVAGKARFVELGIGELRLGKAGWVGQDPVIHDPVRNG